MAEQESSAAEGQSARRGLAAPPAGSHGVLLDGLSFTPLDANGVPPFPRSPKLQRKIAIAAQPSQEQLVRRLEELQAEWSRTGAHIQSLKKRKADLSQVREDFENMRCVLKQDEQAVQDYLDLDLRQTRSRRDQVLNKWHHHQDQVNKSIGSLQRALSSSPAEEGRKSDPLRYTLHHYTQSHTALLLTTLSHCNLSVQRSRMPRRKISA
ncbi:uncharacterized protein si:dkey-219e21.4 isoform X2 [Pseudoliparis swirei]|uniref:uncharacterized protein si:dkey-219e21.4 isoform X2 n=1 Tax=Pseudoliparis swirei TaxID=2059687 RepID=UPI0024BE4814|nr:uncharacterized protein si:dkey-219e21.4 isoform X2 [Pseudoliparis swirei]